MLIKEIAVFVLFLAIFFWGIYYTHIYETDRIDEIVTTEQPLLNPHRETLDC